MHISEHIHIIYVYFFIYIIYIYIHTHCTYTLRIFELVAKFTWRRAAALGIYEKTDCLKVVSAGGVSCGFTTPQTGW